MYQNNILIATVVFSKLILKLIVLWYWKNRITEKTSNHSWSTRKLTLRPPLLVTPDAIILVRASIWLISVSSTHGSLLQFYSRSISQINRNFHPVPLTLRIFSINIYIYSYINIILCEKIHFILCITKAYKSFSLSHSINR